jgi:hypothetical protein
MWRGVAAMPVERQATEYGSWAGWLDERGIVRLGIEVHDAEPDVDEQGFVSVYWTTQSRPSDLVSVLPDFDEQSKVYIPELVAPEDADSPLTVGAVRDVVAENRERFDGVVSFVRADAQSASLIWQYAPCGGEDPLPVIAVVSADFDPGVLANLIGALGDGDQKAPGEEATFYELIARAPHEISEVAAH